MLFTRISLVTNNIWHLFMYLFAICVIFCFFDEVCSNLWPCFKIYFLLCVYFWLSRIFIAEHGLSLALASGAVPQLWVRGLLSSLASLVAAHGLRARAREIWHAGLAAFWYVESSRIRDWTHVPCTCSQILNHWTTKEVLVHFLYWLFTFWMLSFDIHYIFLYQICKYWLSVCGLCF